MIPRVAKGDSQALISQCVLLKKRNNNKILYTLYTMCIDTVCTSVTMQPDHVLSPWTRPPHAAFHASSSAPNPSLWLLSAALLTQLWITCTDEQLRSFLFTNVYKTECQQMRGLRT